MQIALTFFPSVRAAKGKLVRTVWPALLGRLKEPRIVERKDDAPGFSLATYEGNRRSLATVEWVYALGLDFDHGVDWDRLAHLFSTSESFVHTTYSSTAEEPRARVFVRLSRPVTGDEYRRVYTACVDNTERYGLVVDRAASDPSRFWFLPSIPPGGSYAYSVGSGPPVNVDRALAVVPPVAAESTPRPVVSTSARADVVSRARAYLRRCPPAVSGQGGHTHTFVVASKLVRGFALDEETALALMVEWNETCQPPWTRRDLERKVKQAADRGREPGGELRDRPLPRRAS